MLVSGFYAPLTLPRSPSLPDSTRARGTGHDARCIWSEPPETRGGTRGCLEVSAKAKPKPLRKNKKKSKLIEAKGWCDMNNNHIFLQSIHCYQSEEPPKNQKKRPAMGQKCQTFESSMEHLQNDAKRLLIIAHREAQ